MDNSFADLRLNVRASQGEESFWPSFTDIMTVIVMIFLLAMVILLMRNMELMNQLRATMEAERQAAELARTTGEEKESLALRLIDTENELSMLRMQLMQLNESNDDKARTIALQGQSIRRLNSERDRIETQLQAAQRNNQLLSLEVDSLQKQSVRLQDVLGATRNRLDSTEATLSALQQDYETQRAQLTAAQAEAEASRLQLSSLEGDYSSLKIKYDKLVRPARTSAGKYVVEVRYSRPGGRDRIEYKLPGQSAFTAVSRSELDRRFSQLKEQKKDTLYIKVIFPEDSGLSYNEAWKFTSHLHKNYDYYYQEGQPGNPAEVEGAPESGVDATP